MNRFFHARTRRRVVKKFADKVGLLYFGYVNQHSDDHRIVRGFTVSATHQDNHYCVGSIGDYDITMVDRCDLVRQSNDSVATYNWLIMAFDLHTKQDLPHIFINALNHDSRPYTTLFTTFPSMKQIELGTFEDYGPEFTSRFAIYSQPSASIEVEKLFPNIATRVLGTHFWPMSAEVHENILYVYSDEEQVTHNLLDTMLQSGLWLAGHLDLQAEIV